MSDVKPSEAFRAAIDLVIASNEWTLRHLSQFFTVQAVLVGAEGVLLGLSPGSPLAVRWSVLPLVRMMLAALGVVCTWVLLGLYERDKNWQGKYTLAAWKAEGEKPYLYQDEDVQPIQKKTGAYGVRLVRWLKWGVMVGWAYLLLILLVQQSSAQ